MSTRLKITERSQRARRRANSDFFDRCIGWRRDDMQHSFSDGIRRDHFFFWRVSPELVPYLCIGCAWKQRQHADAAFAQVLAQGIGKTQPAKFRSAISGHARKD